MFIDTTGCLEINFYLSNKMAINCNLNSYQIRFLIAII